MAPPSSTLAWRTPWAEEPGGLQSMGRWGSDTTDRIHFHFHFHALEKEMATHSNILAWKSHGQKILVGYSPWGHKELDMTERLNRRR